MRVYISADIEGISGVVNKSHTSPQGYDYNRSRKWMTDEVNAAIDGALAAGATEVLVNDSHGPMTNILIEELHPEARLITGSMKSLGMMEGINGGFDAAMLIGYHARHNTSGVLAHSYFGLVVLEVKINGSVVGEFEFNTMMAAAYGVPVVFVSGDNVLSEQVKTFDPNIRSLAVKEAITRYTANCSSPKKVHEALRLQVADALKNKNLKGDEHKINGDVVLELSFINSGMAEICELIPGVKRITPNTVKYTASCFEEAYKMRAALTTLAGTTV